MLATYHCIDTSCPEWGIEKEIWTKSGEKAKCDTCRGEVVRDYKSGIAIKTNDGYKG